MGKKVTIEAAGFKTPYVGSFVDRKIGTLFLIVYDPAERKAMVSLYNPDTELAATSLDGRTLRLGNAAVKIENASAVLPVPFYENEFTLSLLGRFYKLIPHCEDPHRARWEKVLNRLQPDSEPMSAKEFLDTGREALRLFASMR